MTHMILTDEYAVHLHHKDNWVFFKCYPISYWSNIDNSESGFNYIDKEKEPDEREIFEEDKCLKKIEGSFCWRGVWEGRLYFTDQEYWGEDIEELSRLYNDKIVPVCKNLINKDEI